MIISVLGKLSSVLWEAYVFVMLEGHTQYVLGEGGNGDVLNDFAVSVAELNDADAKIT